LFSHKDRLSIVFFYPVNKATVSMKPVFYETLLLFFLFSSRGITEVYLDAEFGKDDLGRIDVVYANRTDGIFAYDLEGTEDSEIASSSRFAYPVKGGGTRHLIKGLNPPMDFCQSLPFMILGGDTLLFHTQDKTIRSDGRWTDYRFFTWALKFI